MNLFCQEVGKCRRQQLSSLTGRLGDTTYEYAHIAVGVYKNMPAISCWQVCRVLAQRPCKCVGYTAAPKTLYSKSSIQLSTCWCGCQSRSSACSARSSSLQYCCGLAAEAWRLLHGNRQQSIAVRIHVESHSTFSCHGTGRASV